MKLNAKEKLSTVFNTLTGKNGRTAMALGYGAVAATGVAAAFATAAVVAAFPLFVLPAAAWAFDTYLFSRKSNQAAKQNKGLTA